MGSKLNYYILTTVYMAFLLGLSSFSSAQKERPRLVEVGAAIRELHSEIIDQQYELYISLPRNYERDSTKKYPVLYLLDGQYDFPHVVGSYWNQFYDGFVPDIIIVGITGGGEDPDAGFLRGRDFTPSKISFMEHSGGAENFLSVVKEEIIPFVEKEYKASGKGRALAGSSLGGLFTI